MSFRFNLAALTVLAGLGLVTPLAAENAANPALRLTIYTNGLALVDAARTLPVSPSGTVRLDGVGPQLIADSVRVQLADGPQLREISLDSDIMTQQTLLARALGKTVRVIRTNPATGAETEHDAEVLSVQGELVLRMDGRIETGVPGRIVFDDVPEDLHATPRLTLGFDAPLTAPTAARIAYLTGGLSWDAVYTVVLNDAHTHFDLEGWAKVVNNAGVDLGPASVALVAGEVNRESAPMAGKVLMRSESMMAAARSDDAPRRSLSAFHLYDLPDAVTLRDKETTQRRLLSADQVEAERVLEYRRGAPVFGPMRFVAAPEPVRQRIVTENATVANLGVPLPAGLVRAYVRDSGGALRFIGEDRIDNLAVGDELVLDLGEAFDVTVTRRQTDFRQVGERTTEAAFSLRVHNGGNGPATVQVIEDIPGDWEILSESLSSSKDGAAARWRVTVPAQGDVDLTYRVRVRR
jgi:hypothetical protein